VRAASPDVFEREALFEPLVQATPVGRDTRVRGTAIGRT